jgi:hypothetical protein
MANDPEIMEPVVLRDDAARYERTGALALVAKARRRGHWGWNVGKGIEVSPHVRAASPAALYWTGEGRKIPKIRFRRGTVVHRKKFTAVPTGFWRRRATRAEPSAKLHAEVHAAALLDDADSDATVHSGAGP